MSEQLREQYYVDTPVGQARLDWFPARGLHRATMVLGHGTATGVEAADLQALAHVLPGNGITVVLMTQPYRVDGNPRVADERSLDAAWTAVWPEVAGTHERPVIAGGRSAGSQVACRTATVLGADALLVLAYPLRGPGSARELLKVGKPALVVQGGHDPFGRPGEFPALPSTMRLIEIPATNHMFASTVADRAENPIAQLTTAVTTWIDRILATK